MKNKCINRVFKVTMSFLTIAMPFWGAVIGAIMFRIGVMLHVGNVFEKIIPDADMARDIGITACIAIAELFLNNGFNLLVENCVKKQVIELVFYPPNGNPIIENSSLIKIVDESTPKINVRINVSAYKKKCNKMKLIVPADKFYTMQLEKPSSFAKIDENGSLIVDIGELFGEQEYINIKLDFALLFIKNEIGEITSDLKADVINESVFTEFTSNKAVVEIG